MKVEELTKERRPREPHRARATKFRSKVFAASQLHSDDDGSSRSCFAAFWERSSFVTSGLPIRVQLKLCGNQERYSSGLPQNEETSPTVVKPQLMQRVPDLETAEQQKCSSCYSQRENCCM